MRRFHLAWMIVALAAAGCATGRAKTQSEPPSLEVPAPPPRLIVPPDPPEPVETPTVTPGPDAQPPKQQRTRPLPRPTETKADAAKKVEVPPPVVETVPAPAPPVAPPATLQQALPTPAEVERQVRDQLKQAKKDLDRVDYKALTTDAKAQYDTAKQFVQQAEQALTEKNLVFAAKVAEKAAGLAASLPGR